MRFRTFLSVLFLFALAMLLVFLLLPNRAALEQPMDVLGRSVPIWGVVLGAFSLGIGIGIFSLLTGAGRGAATRLVALWSNRHQQAAQRALDRGIQAEREERLDEAVTSFREAASLLPGDYNAQMHLGDALRRTGRASEAVTAHERAQRIDPANHEPRHALALDHLEMGNLEEARRALLALVDANPKGAVGPLRRLRNLEMKAGNWAAAEAAARKLDSLGEKARGASSDDRRTSLGIRTELARSRRAAGQLRSAMGIVKKIQKDDPSFVPAAMLAAELHVDADEIAEARETLVRGFHDTGEPALLDALASIDLRREHPEDAISTLRGIVAGGAQQSAARLALGKLYLRLEMLDEAAQRFEQIYENEGHPPLVAVLLARTEERRGNTARAAQLFRSVLDSGDRAVPVAACEACGTEVTQWSARCPRCSGFGTIRTRWSAIDTGKAAANAPLYPGL